MNENSETGYEFSTKIPEPVELEGAGIWGALSHQLRQELPYKKQAFQIQPIILKLSPTVSCIVF